MSFSFAYLFFLQGEILAEAQFVYSKGTTHYNLFLGAVIATITLQAIQWVVAKISFLPPKWHALSYIPSMLMLAIFTDANRDVLQHFSFGAWTWAAPLVLVLYAVCVLTIRNTSRGDQYSSDNILSEI